jgi:FkbM family methyltransferase
MLGYNISRINRDLYDFFTTSYAVFSYDNAEIFLQEIYNKIVKKGDCVIDVGANHGLHTIPLSELTGEVGHVIACEAVQSNIDDIKEKLNTDNVSFYCAAITKPQVAMKNKEIKFTYLPDLDGWSGIKERPEANTMKKQIITVPTLTLDKIVEDEDICKYNGISFIKIDTEGGDFDVLLGAENTIKKYKPIIIFENAREYSANLYGYKKSDFFEYFAELGYKLFQFIGGEFTENNWGGGYVYNETWAIHKKSKYLRFFEKDYIGLANSYMLRKKKGY